MSMPASISPSSSLQVPTGGTVALFVSSFNPPVAEYLGVVKSLARYSGVIQAWMTPTHGGNQVVEACNFMASVLSNEGVQVAVCTLGVDSKLSSPDDVFLECSKKIKYVSPRMAYLACEYPLRTPGDDDILVIPPGFQSLPCKYFVTERFPLVRIPTGNSLLEMAKSIVGKHS